MYGSRNEIPNVPGLRRDFTVTDRMMKSQHRTSRLMRALSDASLYDATVNVGEAHRSEGGGMAASHSQPTLAQTQTFDDLPMSSTMRSTSGTGNPPETRPWSATASYRKGTKSSMSKQPRFMSKVGEVLRFSAYFTEAVPEFDNLKATEFTRPRVRQMNVAFYLQDSSISIGEVKVANSGLSQGRFLRRSRHPKDAKGTLFDPSDFSIGASFVVNKQTFHIVDADKRTRTWYKRELGVTLDAALPMPDDGFAKERARFEGPQRSSHQARTKSENIYKKEKTVLRFFCAFEDDKYENTNREYHVHYFVEDDTMEVKEVATEGFSKFPHLLSRQKVPLNSTDVPGNDKLNALGENRTIGWRDLKCGGTLMVYNHALLLIDCDERTRAWYARKGITQRPLMLTVEPKAKQAVRVPPYNGYGDEEDLYAMGLSLQPAMNKDKQSAYARFMQNKNKVMRFKAELLDLVNGEKIAENRDFVINYFLEDDTISIFEPELRNTGITGGLFLTRMRYKKHINPKSRASGDAHEDFGGSPMNVKSKGAPARPRSGLLSRWFRPSDFVVGADLTFEMPSTGCTLHRLRVLGMDEYTKGLLQKGVGISSEQGKLHRVLALMSEACCTHRIPLRREFENRDPAVLTDSTARRGRIDDKTFRSTLAAVKDSYGKPAFAEILDGATLDFLVWEFTVMPSNQDELDTAITNGSNALVDYADLCDTLVLATPEPRLLEQVDERNGAGAELTDDNVEESMLKILRAQYNRGDVTAGRFRRTFRELDRYNTGLMSVENWFQALRTHKFHALMTRVRADTIRKRYTCMGDLEWYYEIMAANNDPSADPALRQGDEVPQYVEYHRLCDAIFPSNFDEYVDKLADAVDEFTGGKEGKKFNPWMRDESFARSVSSYERLRTPKSPSRRPSSTNPQAMGEQNTLKEKLKAITTTIASCGGDELKQMERSMQFFSSSFGRTSRKKLLRKNCMAFDPMRTRFLKKTQFVSAIRKSVNEGYVDLEFVHAHRLADFFYPQPEVNEHNYDTVMQILFTRDLEAAKKLRAEAESQKSNDILLFR